MLGAVPRLGAFGRPRDGSPEEGASDLDIGSLFKSNRFRKDEKNTYHYLEIFVKFLRGSHHATEAAVDTLEKLSSPPFQMEDIDRVAMFTVFEE